MSFSTSVAVRRTRGTRKGLPHRCAWCGEWINIGAPAIKVVGYWEDFFSAYLHPECYRASQDEMKREGFVEYDGDCARGRGDSRRDLPSMFPTELPKL